MDNLSKIELSFIDKIIGLLSLKTFEGLLIKKVLESFKLNFKEEQKFHNFKRTKPDALAIEDLKVREFILSKKTIDNLRGNLRFELLTGLQNNESVDQIKRRLDKIFKTNTVNTERIARTEILHSQNSGRLHAYEKSGVVKYIQWKIHKDHRTSDLCKRLDGQIVEIGELFTDPETGKQFKNPPAHSNCRSTILPLRKLPEVTYKSGYKYVSKIKQTGKIEINIGSLSKQAKQRVWVPRSKRAKGYWRMQEAGEKKEKEPKTKMIPENVESVESFYDLGIAGGAHEGKSHIVKFKDGTNAIYKVMGEHDIIGEKLTYDVSKLLSYNIVPETVIDDFGHGKGSCQKWIGGIDEPYSRFGGGDEFAKLNESHYDGLAKMLIIDMITGDNDRHEGNIGVKDNKIHAIDNESWGNGWMAEESLIDIEGRPKDAVLYNPMFRVLEYSDVDLKLFKRHVITNLVEASKHFDSIIHHIEGMKDISGVKTNIEYLRKYVDEVKKSITPRLVRQYQILCQELDITPYSAMNPQQMRQKVDEMMETARKTPGSQYYMKMINVKGLMKK